MRKSIINKNIGGKIHSKKKWKRQIKIDELVSIQS